MEEEEKKLVKEIERLSKELCLLRQKMGKKQDDKYTLLEID